MLRSTQQPFLIIGIDPGVNTGFAIYDKRSRQFKVVKSMNIVNTLLELQTLSLNPAIKLIVVENPSLNSPVFHKDTVIAKSGIDGFAKKAQNVGAVGRDAVILLQWCKALFNEVDIREHRPSKSNSLLTKQDHATFCKMTGYTGKSSSEHSRDAGMLAWFYSK